MKLTAVIFDRMTALDVVGPLEVFARVPEMEIEYVTPSGSIRAEDTGLLFSGVQPLDAVTETDILLMPGGMGTRALATDAPVLDWVRAIDETTTWTTSVCTGSLVLAGAGLLDGRPATTHWAAYELLKKYGAEPTERRVVFSDKYVTAAGVSSGIDMALELVRRLESDDLAKAIQLLIEYDPQPPFDSGAPSKATPEILALAGEVLGR